MKYMRRSDGTVWPDPDILGELQCAMRYGTPSRSQLYEAAEVLLAYRELLRGTQEKREIVVRSYRNRVDKPGE